MDTKRATPLPHGLAALRATLQRFPLAAGYLRIEYEDHTIDVILGAITQPESSLEMGIMLAGTDSPLAEIFVRCKTGDSFTLAGARGVVRARMTLPRASRQGLVLRARERGARERASLIDVTLSPSQTRAVELPEGRSQLVLGEAGHGKTTVALHRLARLYKAATGRFRAVVIVPGEGLRELLERLLVRIGADVAVMTYDDWAMRQATRAFVDVSPRASALASVATQRLKRDPAIEQAIAEIAAKPPAVIDDDRDAPRIRTRAHARRADLQRLFGDREILSGIATRSRADLGEQNIADTLEHTHVQFSLSGEEEWASVTDRERLIAVDKLSLDDGTPNADAGTIDVEDVAVLFEIDRLRAERRGMPETRPRRFDCIVVDEAQELSPLELSLVGRSLRRDGTLIVAGDAEQQLDEGTWFEGWPHTMRRLGCDEYDTTLLDVGYRCPPDVVKLAHRALGRGASIDDVSQTTVRRFAHELHLADWLARELRSMKRRDRRASVAIITRAAPLARRLADLLRSTGARLVLDGHFSLGVAQITTVAEVRGLEFDIVIIPDASEESYPATPHARRALYVAITRARHQVVLASVSPETRILRE